MKCATCDLEAEHAIYFTGASDDPVPHPACWRCCANAASAWEQRVVKERQLRLVYVDLEDILAYRQHEARREVARCAS